MTKCANEKFINNIESQIFSKKNIKKNLNIFLLKITWKNIKKARKDFRQQNELNHASKVSIEYIKHSALRIIQQSHLLESDSISIMKNLSHTRNLSQFRSQISVFNDSKNSSSNNNSDNSQSSVIFWWIWTSKNQFSASKNKDKKKVTISSSFTEIQNKQIKANLKQTLKQYKKMNILSIVKKLWKVKLSFQHSDKFRQTRNHSLSLLLISKSSVSCQKKSDTVSESFQKLVNKSF